MNIWKRNKIKFKESEGKASKPFNRIWWLIGLILLLVISILRRKFF